MSTVSIHQAANETWTQRFGTFVCSVPLACGGRLLVICIYSRNRYNSSCCLSSQRRLRDQPVESCTISFRETSSSRCHVARCHLPSSHTNFNAVLGSDGVTDIARPPSGSQLLILCVCVCVCVLFHFIFVCVCVCVYYFISFNMLF